MADDVISTSGDSAEEAYAAAAEALPLKAEPEAPAAKPTAAPEVAEVPAPPPVEFPAKAKRAAKAAAAAPVAPDLPKPRQTKPRQTKPRKTKARTPAVAKASKPARLPAAKAKPAAPKPAAAKTIAPKTIAKPAKKAAAKPKPAAALKTSTAPQPKEKSMDKTNEFVAGVQKAAAETQTKAKQAFEKGSAMFGEYAEFAKGNVEALVESGKILAAGMQGMGSTMMAEGKSALETVTGDVKQLSAVKSPGELLKLQTDILRRNLDNAVKLGTKNGEAMMKLASDSFAPISGRFALAVEKIKKAA